MVEVIIKPRMRKKHFALGDGFTLLIVRTGSKRKTMRFYRIVIVSDDGAYIDWGLTILCRGLDVPILKEAGLGEEFRVNRHFSYQVQIMAPRRTEVVPTTRPPGRTTR